MDEFDEFIEFDSIEEKMNLIKEYITEKECNYIRSKHMFDCEHCINFEDCFIEADIRQNDDFNSVFAKMIDYGGYSNEDDFWEQLLD